MGSQDSATLLLEGRQAAGATKLMATIGEARSPDLVGEIAPKVLERADQVVKELNDTLIPQGEKFQESMQASKVHWGDFTERVKNALKATKNFGDRLHTLIKNAQSDDERGDAVHYIDLH